MAFVAINHQYIQRNNAHLFWKISIFINVVQAVKNILMAFIFREQVPVYSFLIINSYSNSNNLQRLTCCCQI